MWGWLRGKNWWIPLSEFSLLTQYHLSFGKDKSLSLICGGGAGLIGCRWVPRAEAWTISLAALVAGFWCRNYLYHLPVSRAIYETALVIFWTIVAKTTSEIVWLRGWWSRWWVNWEGNSSSKLGDLLVYPVLCSTNVSVAIFYLKDCYCIYMPRNSPNDNHQHNGISCRDH